MKNYRFFSMGLFMLILIACKRYDVNTEATTVAADSTFTTAEAPLVFEEEAPSANDNTESYAEVAENPFESPKTAPLSTFSIDVDNASYTNIRRFINNGQPVPKEAVRVEEMVNFF